MPQLSMLQCAAPSKRGSDVQAVQKLQQRTPLARDHGRKMGVSDKKTRVRREKEAKGNSFYLRTLQRSEIWSVKREGDFIER